eukprot:TRINITY_DN27647_c0_g1_i1.p1 TRINITY_DN27647_c0_g1~~TRINITY_DN27647_c0_g1_i1.p1  ORF type:complete len:236 (-),score=30.99 TRINITY_DN27647_c0_g1_i1:17-679(-)
MNLSSFDPHLVVLVLVVVWCVLLGSGGVHCAVQAQDVEDKPAKFVSTTVFANDSIAVYAQYIRPVGCVDGIVCNCLPSDMIFYAYDCNSVCDLSTCEFNRTFHEGRTGDIMYECLIDLPSSVPKSSFVKTVYNDSDCDTDGILNWEILPTKQNCLNEQNLSFIQYHCSTSGLPQQVTCKDDKCSVGCQTTVLPPGKCTVDMHTGRFMTYTCGTLPHHDGK